MEIKEIIAGCGTTFNHPFERFANFRPTITVRAVLDDGDDYQKIASDLQEQAFRLVNAAKKRILDNIEKEHFGNSDNSFLPDELFDDDQR